MTVNSFEPIIDHSSKILILGTMPGIKSLEMQQYYANERNLFWAILFKLFEQCYSNDYTVRKNLLLKNAVAVWDTLKLCQRNGSLDSEIQDAEPNNLHQLINDYPTIKTILFNGKYAESFYKKHNPLFQGINYVSMPSTSPANARYNYEYKLKAWSVLKKYL